MQLWCEAHFGVDNAVAREIDGALGGYPLELVARLHQSRGVREALEVAHEVTARTVHDEPAT